MPNLFRHLQKYCLKMPKQVRHDSRVLVESDLGFQEGTQTIAVPDVRKGIWNDDYAINILLYL